MLHRSRTIVMAVGVLALALVPPAAAALNQPFYVDLFRRMMIFALAALSLDLVLGYGGMVSFGHAAYLGIGAYAVGILAGGARHRCDLDPDQRRVLHHDHARLRADALLSRDQPRDLRRRQRDAAPDAQPVRRAHRPQEPVRVLLPRPGAARALPGPGPPARQRALRHGHPGREVQRAARAGDRLLAVPLQARRLRP